MVLQPKRMNVYYTSANLDWLTEVNGRGFTARHTTKQWGAIHKHPDRDEWCAEIPGEYAEMISEVVKGNELMDNAKGPLTQEQMAADGWFG